MREEYSLKKLFLGLTLRPENKANPSSATSDMTWLFRSSDQSLRARLARKAWSGGIIWEPGRRAASARVWMGRRANSGRNRKRPPHLVRKRRGAREKARTSVTAWTVGPGRGGRSASSRRGSAAKPSALRTSRTAVGLKGSFWALSASLIS